MTRYQLTAAAKNRNRALFIDIRVLNQAGLHEVNKTIILMNVIQYMYLMMMMRFSIISWKMGSWKDDEKQTRITNKRVGELYWIMGINPKNKSDQRTSESFLGNMAVWIFMMRMRIKYTPFITKTFNSSRKRVGIGWTSWLTSC